MILFHSNKNTNQAITTATGKWDVPCSLNYQLEPLFILTRVSPCRGGQTISSSACQPSYLAVESQHTPCSSHIHPLLSEL